MAYGHHTLGRAFSVNTLDGIEVKIGENFKPVDKVTLPMRYRQADPTDVLQTAQYDFETEITFLSWLAAKKKAEAEKEAAKKAALMAQQQEAETAAAAAAAAAAARQPQQVPVTSQQQPVVSMNNSVSPVISGVGHDILMPTQLHSGATATTVPPKMKSQTSFDPRDFENNAFDPFEMTELQTLNDMDELRAVLGNSIPQQQQQQQQGSSAEPTDKQQGSAQNHFSSAEQNHTVSSSSNNVETNDASLSDPEYQNIKRQPDYQNVQQQQRQDLHQKTVATPSKENDYQNVQIQPGTGLVMFKPDKPGSPLLPPRDLDQTAPNGALSPNLMPNGVGDMPEGTEKASTINLTFPSSRTPLPPIIPSSSRENTSVSIASGTGSSSSVCVVVVVHLSLVHLHPLICQQGMNRGANRGVMSHRQEAEAGPLPQATMQWIMEEETQEHLCQGLYRPGYPTELPPAYPESLSRYSPLPEAPRQRTLSEEERCRPDPVYDVMSTEDKNFVMTIMGMGFPKSRTARVVKRIGKDDRLVVESLCAVESLCSEGFPEERAEEALNLHDNNQETAKDFLKLLKQFEELGFKGDDIKRELIVHNNNHEKVLDSLTA
ncbi:LOW QUALITY PROTEIN: uncharacterized protein [Amphiura filiformis]|uniref:LOW QUALITY PROTEIN: uncharacterized protein n=1 Tax=Amphiura filiformis TaxID=82378 RepID=UPI003B2230A6